MDRLAKVSDECSRIQRDTNIPDFFPAVLHISCDVSIKSDVDALVQMAVDKLGGIDVMVANAGIYKTSPILEMSDEMFDQVYAVNVKGVFHCYQAAACAMIPRGGGRIIGACSASGKGGDLNKAAYCSSKFAVRGLSQSAAREWAKYGVTVNTYAPGPVDTDMWNKDVLGGIGESEQIRKLASGIAPSLGHPLTIFIVDAR
ncbi:short chain dehydrogenase [Ceratobasidium sp. AG-Ba]|nr:short chain dehydrogenase [Ceratobasidium sp. AG-Ba]